MTLRGQFLALFTALVMLTASPVVCCCEIRSALDHVIPTAPAVASVPACPLCAKAENSESPKLPPCRCNNRDFDGLVKSVKFDVPSPVQVAVLDWPLIFAVEMPRPTSAAMPTGRAPPWRHPPRTPLFNQHTLLLM